MIKRFLRWWYENDPHSKYWKRCPLCGEINKQHSIDCENFTVMKRSM